MKADPKDDPKGIIGAEVAYRAHVCPLCNAIHYDETFGVKQPPHVCKVQK